MGWEWGAIRGRDRLIRTGDRTIRGRETRGNCGNTCAAKMKGGGINNKYWQLQVERNSLDRFYVNGDNVKYFDSFGVEHKLEENIII